MNASLFQGNVLSLLRDMTTSLRDMKSSLTRINSTLTEMRDENRAYNEAFAQ